MCHSRRRYSSRTGGRKHRYPETCHRSGSGCLDVRQSFWDAGVPKEALQVIITNREALKVLTTAPAIKHIILTGGTDTAQNIARANPVTPLSAETGGKTSLSSLHRATVTMLS